MMGHSLRQAFEMSLSTAGSTVQISHPSSGGMPSTAKAIKHQDGGGEYFSFLSQGDLAPGCAIARIGASESWIVDRIEPSITSDVLVKVKAYVHRASSAKVNDNPLPPGSLVINASNNSYVTLQHGGQGNTQKVHISSRNEVSRHLEDLKRIISESTLEEIDKEDAQAEISRISELSTKNQTADVLKRMDDRLGIISSIVARASGLAVLVAPAIEGLRKALGG